MIHPLSDVHPEAIIGPNTKVWQFVVITKGAVIGDHCNINAYTGIEDDVVIGDHVTLKCFVGLGGGTRIGNHVFVGPYVACINDRAPRSQQYQDFVPTTILEDWCSIGAAAVIQPGIRIGRYAMVAAGSLVTRDVPDHALVGGSPARRIKWVDTNGQALEMRGEEYVSATGEVYRRGEKGLVRRDP